MKTNYTKNVYIKKEKVMAIKTIINNLLKCKSPQELIDEGSKSGLKKDIRSF